MKKFCNCNSKWFFSLDTCTTKQITGSETPAQHTFGGCSTCGLRYWIDADYENMLHDLKSMNQ